MKGTVTGFARAALAVALFGVALSASAQTEIQFWHSMTGALGDRVGASRAQIFGMIWERAFGEPAGIPPGNETVVPRLTEAWYCCAEPAEDPFTVV